MKLEFALESRQGPRPDNQDSINHFDSAYGTIFILADGMGGHRGGGIASKLAAEKCEEVMLAMPESSIPEAALAQAIQEVNRIIFGESIRGDAANRRMGTTIVALLVSQTSDGLLAIGAHVGDSRLYFAREGRLFRLTQDHTMVQQLLLNSILTEEQAKDHPQAGVLTRALGQKEEVTPDLTSWMLLKPGDTFLLCSDGLWGYIDDSDIGRILLQPDVCPAIALNLLDVATKGGSDDNMSALVVRAAL